jgi:hypothetical protein
MLIGYPLSHGKNVYKSHNLETKGILISRNVVWLIKVYGDDKSIKALITPIDAYEAEYLEPSNSPVPPIPSVTIDRDLQHRERQHLNDAVQVTDVDHVNDHDYEAESTVVSSVRTSGLDRHIRDLTTYYNPNPRDHMEAAAFSLDETALASQQSAPDMSIFPSTYHEALKRRDHYHWWTAMKVKIHNAESKNIWRIVKKSSLPQGRKIIGNRWVFAQKDDG